MRYRTLELETPDPDGMAQRAGGQRVASKVQLRLAYVVTKVAHDARTTKRV